MDHDSLVRAAKMEVEALTHALGSGESDVPVPTCEGWTVHDLAVHVGEFCGFWGHVLCEATGRPKPSIPDPPAGDAVAPWVAEAAGILIAELEATPAHTPAWTWFEGDRTAGFVARRSAHELAIHRYDAEATWSIGTPVPAALAADGIDEVLDVLITARDRTGEGSGRVLVLRSSDLGIVWTVTLEPDRVVVDRRSREDPPIEGASLVVSGTASDLELTLYSRPSLGPVDMQGDYTVLAEWHREFRF
jgi:uncharacterized protein (TIGR03083 family)